MAKPEKHSAITKQQFEEAIQKESERFQKALLWLDGHMPPKFFEEVGHENIVLVAHNLMSLDIQDYFAHIHLKHSSIVLCLDSSDADLRILKHYRMYGIKNYRAFVSDEAPPLPGIKEKLRVATIFFTEFIDKPQVTEALLPLVEQKEILKLVKARNPEFTEAEFKKLIDGMNPRFLRSLTKERLAIALDLFSRAKTRDPCQYEVKYNKDWKQKSNVPSMQIVLAWRNVPKYNFIYRLAKTIHRHRLIMKKVNATYIDPYSSNSVLIMSLGLDGRQGKAAWEEADIQDFLKELVTVKYFEGLEMIETLFVDSGLLSGNLGNLVKTMVYFVHQVLVHADINMYSLSHIEEGLCRHPELTVQLCTAFEQKFHPEKHSLEEFEKTRTSFLKLVEDLDTGNQLNDMRRKNILKQAMNLIHYTLKTNFYRNNKTAFSFRLDPQYLDNVPYDRKEKFPELPYAVFFMKGMHFIGFHIRFKDLARGGLRTVYPERMEQLQIERNNVFAECYNLAYTQQKKNKDIPEGGSKAVILMEPFEKLLAEGEIYKRELEAAGVDPMEIDKKIAAFHKDQKLEYLYQTQRCYIESFLTLINCEDDGTLKAKNIVDYWKRPEYIYLGPDENMHNAMIEWIANFSKYHDYKPKGAFISSKPTYGINHKEYGVTSLGVNVYMEEVLKFLGIDPKKDPFTIKISGGPDGDVAGNQLLNLHRFYPKTTKLVALTDGSGTINDPEGIDLGILVDLFIEEKPIRFYPPEKLSEGGFLLDIRTKREQTAYAQQTLCWRKKGGKVLEDWLSGNEMNHLYRHNVHQTKTDIFIPAGGRPRTLNDANYTDYLDEEGKPTSKAIVEGANLYLTPGARRSLEKLGVIDIKDSSANKGGVMCSSLEVLFGLTLTEEEFLKEKPNLMKDVLEFIRGRSKSEAELLLRTFSETGDFLTDISEAISERINRYKYELLEHFQTVQLSDDPEDPYIRCLLSYCPSYLRSRYQERILTQIPDIHKKAMISCYIASQLVYTRGLSWAPSLVDVLPLVISGEL